MHLDRTPKIDEAIDYWRKQGNSVAEEDLGADWVDHSLLIQIAKGSELSLVSLVKGSGVYISPPPPPVEKPKEYIEFMERLRYEAQEKEYQELTGKKDEEAPVFAGGDIKQVKEELATIANFAVSLFAVGFALWYWARSWDPAPRVLLSVLGSLFVLLAEVVVYLGYRRRIDEARRVERNKREVKKIRDTIVIEPSNPSKEQVLEEKQGSSAVQRQAVSRRSKKARKH